ncbi:MAG TPA: glycosyltransferase family 2 protein [Puia sp.]|nr:glycosyltransferase family 2 protein [Puia sp.]
MTVFFEALRILFLIVQVLLAIYLFIPAILLLCYGIICLFRIRTPFERRPFLTDKQFEFGLIITAHQETEFVIPLIDSILKQTYKNLFVYVVADDCDPTKPLSFSDPRITILTPEPALHSKIRSIQYALDRFRKKHDAFIILDVDNLLHPSFLEVMNNHFRKGYRVVQANFKPKNTDTMYARMDAIGDMFNFFIEREARMRLGLSSAIWGSGIAIDLDLYQSIKYTDLLGGFDKMLQSHLVQRVDRIAFAPDAILFDEKIITGKSLENQRTRWLSSHFKYFKTSFGILARGIRKFDLNLVYFGYNTIRPPLFIVLGASFLFMVIDYFTDPALFYAWLLALLSFLLSFVLIVIIKGKDIRYIKTLFFLFLFALRQAAALLKIKKARKSFLKTQHSRLIFIDDLLKSPPEDNR